MKFLSFIRGGKQSWGALTAMGIVDFGVHRPDLPDLRAALRAGCLDELTRAARARAADFGLTELTYLPPVPNPGKIICIGVNYAERNAEYRDGSEPPGYPSVFMRSRESLTGHLQPLFDPPESDQLDYEGEIVLVIGKSGRRITEAQAREHIAGLTVMNEGSVRDWLRHSKFNVTQGKNFERSGAVGPFLVTSDEVDPLGELRVITRVNGAERQNDVTSNLIFSFARLISYLSTFYRLQPGDLIATGTPNGAGARLDPPTYLRPGDVVEVEVPGVGTLRNSVVKEPG